MILIADILGLAIGATLSQLDKNKTESQSTSLVNSFYQPK